jgi:hypothetical protein
MGKINWGRVFLCGLLASIVWGVPSAILVHRVGRDWQIAVHAGRPSPTEGGLFFAVLGLVNLVTGIWTMWLYAAIRPRYGPGPKTAAMAGLALWVIVAMAHVVWAVFGSLPPSVLVIPDVAQLPVIIVGAVVGAWPYKE